jgi:hypothetical protein
MRSAAFDTTNGSWWIFLWEVTFVSRKDLNDRPTSVGGILIVSPSFVSSLLLATVRPSLRRIFTAPFFQTFPLL